MARASGNPHPIRTHFLVEFGPTSGVNAGPLGEPRSPVVSGVQNQPVSGES